MFSTGTTHPQTTPCLCCAELCCDMLCCAVTCCGVLWCAVLCCAHLLGYHRQHFQLDAIELVKA